MLSDTARKLRDKIFAQANQGLACNECLSQNAGMKQPSAIDDRIAKLCAQLSLQIIGQVGRGKITLGFLERSLDEFAQQIRPEVES